MNIEGTDGQEAAPVEAAPVIEQAAPEQVETTAESTPAETDGADDTAHVDDGSEVRKPAKGVQKRLDELTRQRHETARERDYWREQAMALAKPEAAASATPASPEAKPQVEQFETYEDYVEALSDWKVEQKLGANDRKREAETRQQTISRKLSEAGAAKPDFADVIADIPLTPAVEAVLVEADNATDILYELGSNPEALAKFARLSVAMQAVELGRIAAGISPAKPTPNRAPPPAPVKTVTGMSAAVNKTPAEMTMDEYAAWRKAG